MAYAWRVHAFDSRLPSSTVSRSARAVRLAIPPPPPPKRESSSVGFFAGLDGRTQRLVGRCLGRCLAGALGRHFRAQALLLSPPDHEYQAGRAPQAVGGQLCRCQVDAESDCAAHAFLVRDRRCRAAAAPHGRGRRCRQALDGRRTRSRCRALRMQVRPGPARGACSLPWCPPWIFSSPRGVLYNHETKWVHEPTDAVNKHNVNARKTDYERQGPTHAGSFGYSFRWIHRSSLHASASRRQPRHLHQRQCSAACSAWHHAAHETSERSPGEG